MRLICNSELYGSFENFIRKRIAFTIAFSIQFYLLVELCLHRSLYDLSIHFCDKTKEITKMNETNRIVIFYVFN